jgi:hypothetical protein
MNPDLQSRSLKINEIKFDFWEWKNPDNKKIKRTSNALRVETRFRLGKYLLKYFYGFYFGAIWPPEASPHKSIFSEPI